MWYFGWAGSSNYLYATSQLARTTLRSVLGEAELDELLSRRGKLNLRLQSILDQHTASWGMKVTLVEIGGEHNTTIVFPLPIDLVASMAELLNGSKRIPAGAV